MGQPGPRCRQGVLLSVADQGQVGQLCHLAMRVWAAAVG